MLLTLLAGITHTVQHDMAAEHVSHVAEVHHANELHAEDNAEHHKQGEHTVHTVDDCLLGDLTAAKLCLPLSSFSFVALPRPDTPKLTPPVTRMVGVTQARAPPISL